MRQKKFRDSCQIFKKFPDHAHEPLLQHYGIKTTWIDIVDNIWVALWFSVFESFSAGENNEFVHLDMRKPSVDSPFGYLLLLVVSENRRLTPVRGMVKGTNTEVVDLRVAAPSVFLRPHAQHGLLLRVKGTNTGRELDYFSAVRGIIRYDLEDAIDWLVF